MSEKRPEMRREMDIRVDIVRNMDFFFLSRHINEYDSLVGKLCFM